MTEPENEPQPEGWAGGYVPGREAEGRVSDDPDAWVNRRDRDDDEPQYDERRLTWEERYGVQFNVDPDTIGKE